MTRITLYGFYQYDNTLFDDVVLPDGMDKDILISDIIRTSGDLYPYHQIPQRLKRNITVWFSRRLFDFECMYKAMRTEYDPFENYDRIENTRRVYQNSGQDKEVSTLGSTTTSKHTGNDSAETQVSAYNQAEYSNRDKETQTYNSSTATTGSGSDVVRTEYGSRRVESEEMHAHGNIGVDSNQHMIEQEMELRARYDLYRIITMEFEREFLIQIY